MVIENRNLPAGTVLTATHKGLTHRCEVIETAAGTRYRLEDGRDFGSPSAAGSAVMSGVACNGWRFWAINGERERQREERVASGRKSKRDPKQQLKRVPNQRGCPEGETRWFCSGCMASFFAEKGTEPEFCPEGHGREAEDEMLVAETER